MRIAAALFFFLAAGTSVFAGAADTLPLPAGCQQAGDDLRASTDDVRSGASFPPVQLEVLSPFEPTAFPAGDHVLLMYELHLQNFLDAPLGLQAIEVRDATHVDDRPLFAFSGPLLSRTLVPVGPGSANASQLDAGRRSVFYACLAFDADEDVPERLGHRVLLDGATAEGPILGTRTSTLKVLGPPVSGSGWMAVSGLNFSSHHRSGLFVAGGKAQISRRYAIDWKRAGEDAFFSGDARDVHAHHSYGELVYAVAEATVVLAKDGYPDNVPRTQAGFQTALPITMDNIAGNAVVLDIGDGQFAYYAHLKPGSVRVATGDRVRQGQVLGMIGNSGDAREPHLHFQVTNGPDILASEGLPYVIDRHRIRSVDGNWQVRSREFPLGGVAIDFTVEDAGASPAMVD
jgi:hypothetical protein